MNTETLGNADTEATGVPAQARKPKIILWGVNFPPEKTGIAPQNARLAQALQQAGFVVEMVTSFPYYPKWELAPGDIGARERHEDVAGISVHRCWQYVPNPPSLFRRILQQVSFVASSGCYLLRTPAPDAYLAVLPPFSMSFALRIISRIKGAPYGIHLQDDEIQAAIDTSKSLKGCMQKLLRGLESFGYRSASLLSSISPGMSEQLQQYKEKAGNDLAGDVIQLSNAAHFHDQPIDPAEIDAFRARFQESRLLVYAGNFGDKQMLQDIIEAIALPRLRDIRLIIAGRGAQQESIKARINSGTLTNVTLFDLLPAKDHAILLQAADACLISEKTKTGAWLSPGVCFPSKVYSYWNYARPVVVYASPQSELSRLCDREQLGLALKDNENAVNLLLRFLESQNLAAMGQKGLAYKGEVTNERHMRRWIEAIRTMTTAQAWQARVESSGALSRGIKVLATPVVSVLAWFAGLAFCVTRRMLVWLDARNRRGQEKNLAKGQ